MPHTTARYPSGMARIAVIGAGMGSLATTARLAAAGHRVTVYERAATYGGGVGRFERAGFAFDTGPGLLHLPAVWRDLFVKTCGGRRDGTLERCVDLVPVDPAARHLLPDGTDLLLPNTSRAGVTAALDAALGAGAGERWSAMLNRARQAWEATRRPLLEDTLAEDTAELGRDPYPARRGLLRRGSPTLREMAARELRDPRLEALLGSYALAYGYEPGAVPASAAVLAYLEQTFGVWYVRGGGMRALADAVYRRCLERGAEFRFGAEVTGVAEKDGRVAFRGHGVFIVDPLTQGIAWWWFDSLGFAPEPPARGRWDGDILRMEKHTPRGAARYTFALGDDAFVFRIENRFAGQDDYVEFMRGDYRRLR